MVVVQYRILIGQRPPIYSLSWRSVSLARWYLSANSGCRILKRLQAGHHSLQSISRSELPAQLQLTTRYTSAPINDSIWLAGGSLAIGAGNQIYLFSRFLDRDTSAPSPSASAKSVVLDPEGPEDLFQLIAWQNGPLLDYHPTILAQCLIWGESLAVMTG